MTRRKPLGRRTVTWIHKGDGRQHQTIYLVPRHHDDRPDAAAANQRRMFDTAAYDQACADSQATVVSHTEVDDDG